MTCGTAIVLPKSVIIDHSVLNFGDCSVNVIKPRTLHMTEFVLVSKYEVATISRDYVMTILAFTFDLLFQEFGHVTGSWW